uniref:Carboxylic ester hydrolase n=1 Tax=Heterorhabditis bacteriophora TaxID=37862 RepID=A0A1I7XFE5_HETBA
MGTCESLVRKEVLPRKQITTTSGIVEGSRHETADGFLSDVFLGIPYAKPPIGELRFKVKTAFEALKWTKENIHSFGGDPNQITIGGQSAGGVSTDLLSISPLSRDMFHRKIVMGGSSFNSWAVSSKEEITDYCRQKAIKVGWKPRKEDPASYILMHIYKQLTSGYSSQLEENESMVEYLRTVPAAKFGTHMIGCRVVFEECRLPLAPVIDGEILPKEIPLMRAEAPPKESIVGVGQEESLLFIALDAIKCDGKDMNKLIGALSKKTKKVGQKDITEAIRKLYGYTDMVSYNKKAMRKIFATCLSDVISNYACYRYMQHSQSHMKDTYAYSFDYTSKNMWGWLIPMIPYMAGTHSSDIIYLFDCNYFTAPLPMNKTDRRISQMTSSYFAQFVKKGNPNSEHTSNFEWKPIKKDSDVQMFSICKEPKMLDEVFGNRITQLDSIMAEIQYVVGDNRR